MLSNKSIPVVETIAAVATPPGIGGIGIIRISGPSALDIAQILTGTTLEKGRALFRKFLDETAHPIDHGLCIYSHLQVNMLLRFRVTVAQYYSTCC
jgi:tRNA U34 5-carboxymethylaminomethyl modifying GTPase MnmE/TrmE